MKFTDMAELSKPKVAGERKRGPKPGSPRVGGRSKGTPNKITKELKDMILGALDDAGGQEYLKEQAVLNPGPFMALVGKVLPTTLNAKVDGGLVIQVATGVPESPEDKGQ